MPVTTDPHGPIQHKIQLFPISTQLIRSCTCTALHRESQAHSTVHAHAQSTSTHAQSAQQGSFAQKFCEGWDASQLSLPRQVRPPPPLLSLAFIAQPQPQPHSTAQQHSSTAARVHSSLCMRTRRDIRARKSPRTMTANGLFLRATFGAAAQRISPTFYSL